MVRHSATKRTVYIAPTTNDDQANSRKPMQILVLNAGSSSLKFGVFHMDGTPLEVLRGSFQRFRGGMCEVRIRYGGMDERRTAKNAGVAEAATEIPSILGQFGLATPDAIGHRFVHGGDRFPTPAIIEGQTLAWIEALNPLAPLHNPANVEMVRLCRKLWPGLPQVAVFDTSYHLSNPSFATTYAVPKTWRDAGLRRYGFHGTSHRYVAERAADELGRSLADFRIVSLHLGSGASICAIDRGRSVDSSMGLTPLEGLVMGTRSGDLDPGAFGFLSRQLGLSIADIETALYTDSGLKGLAGSADLRDLEERVKNGDQDARLAIEVYAYRAKKYVGAYAAAMAGLEVIIFTGGIGENSAPMRQCILDGLEFMGARLDAGRNQSIDLSNRAAPQIQAKESRVHILVTETAEELMIARETAAALATA
jgi:acetate kinase